MNPLWTYKNGFFDSANAVSEIDFVRVIVRDFLSENSFVSVLSGGMMLLNKRSSMSELDALAQAAHTSYPRPSKRPQTVSPAVMGFQAALAAAPVLFVTILLAVLAAEWITAQYVRSAVDDAVQKMPHFPAAPGSP